MTNENERLCHEITELKTDLMRLGTLKAENKALRARLSDAKSYRCQCLTEKGEQCPKKAVRENKKDDFIIFTCAHHYQAI